MGEKGDCNFKLNRGVRVVIVEKMTFETVLDQIR